MKPSVCVLLSTYNGEAFLEAQLESLRAQTGVSLQLHVRDDGSTDGTLAVLGRYADVWPQAGNTPSGPNLGPAASFLELLRTAPHADYYAFCDQDDVWLPDKLARAVGMLSGEHGPALYCSNVTCVAEDLAVLGIPPENGDPRLQHLLFENIAYGCTSVMNRAARELVVQRMPDRGMVMHDWWCALVTAAFGRILYDPEPSLLYRQHGGNSIGARSDPLSQAISHMRRFARSPRAFYAVQAQAAELNRLYGADLRDEPGRVIARVARSKEGLLARCRLAISADVTRARLVDSIVVRSLILAGLH